MNVELEILNEAGEVIGTETGPLQRVRNNMAFVFSFEAAYCLAEDECAGYFCCDVESRVRLSQKSLEACRALREGEPTGHLVVDQER